MFIGLTVPIFILGSLALALADYLWRLIKPPVPATVPLSVSYAPPFLGGQCVGVSYIVSGRVQFDKPDGTNEGGNVVSSPVLGAIKRVYVENVGGSATWKVESASGITIVAGVGNPNDWIPSWQSILITRQDGGVDNCGDIPSPNPSLPIGGNGLPSTPAPVLYPPPNSPPNTPPTTPNNNWLQLIAGVAAVAATALTAATAAAAATAATAVTAATAASTAAAAAIASAPSGSTTQQQAQSQKLSADALVGIAQVLAEVAKQIAELEKEVRKVKTDEAKKVIRYDFGSANRDGFIKLYPESNPDSYEATFVDVQIFNIPSGSGKYFGEKSPHYYKYKSLGQIHFVSPTFGILESREIDFARLSLNVPDNCFGFFYHFGLDGIVSANLSCFYTKTEKQSV